MGLLRGIDLYFNEHVARRYSRLLALGEPQCAMRAGAQLACRARPYNGPVLRRHCDSLDRARRHEVPSHPHGANYRVVRRDKDA
jgi:hypothetical protein